MSKLHPIYVALDNHQFSRAIKLALALPDSNILGKALLAHAYSKSGQRYLSLVTIYKLLSNTTILGNYFWELKQEIEGALEAIEERDQQETKTANIAPEPASAKGNKAKKGGKKKEAAKGPMTAPATKEASKPIQDLIDQLNTRPILPEGWDIVPSLAHAITDETTLGTLSVTLNGLKLPLTAYQLYAWAAASGEANETILRKTFCQGLNVLAAPSKWTRECQEKIETHVLTNIQTVALHWAKLYANQPGGLGTFPPMLATAWAAQSALWQLQWLPKDDKRALLLPRLAESMAERLLQQDKVQANAAEIQLLALRALRHQGKWQQILHILEQSESSNVEDNASPVLVSDFGVALTKQQTLTEKARVLCELEQFDSARKVYEELLATSPDDWSCWKGHLDCCNKLDQVSRTTDLVGLVLTEHAGGNYPLRGPHLMKVELAAHAVRCNPNGETIKALSSSIQNYGHLFSSKAACAFSDVEAYIELLLLSTDLDKRKEVAQDVLQFSKKLRSENGAPPDNDNEISNKDRQARLRTYIFATKVNHKILAKNADHQDEWLPDWTELVKEWKSTLSMSSSNEGEESQKEIKPGDDLVLLAVQQLLFRNPGSVECQLVCAALLETAMDHSPDNAYLKMLAIQVYYQLDSVSRSWECFQGMNVKHIQLDSCIFTIVPYLMQGGLYNEAIEVSNALLRFQASTARDCGDYAGRAMDGGTIRKANEFLVFQREKMNNSLSVLDAKGMILDSAPLLATALPRKKHDEDPLFKGSLGVHQGIVGGEEDMARATQMVVEAHNPYSALSLVSWVDHGGCIQDCNYMADNRDLSICSQQLLLPTSLPSNVEICQDALRRGHVHGMLIRTTLCLDATKGPKKGKIVKASDILEKRTKSLLDCVDAVDAFIKEHYVGQGTESECYLALLSTSMELCRTLAIINTGLPSDNNLDSLEHREHRAHELLHTTALPLLKQANEFLVLSVKSVCSLLPNYIVPLFALFRMCDSVCSTYGWGKRKHKTKRCAGAMKEVAETFQHLIEKMISALASLPASEEVPDKDKFGINDVYSDLLGEISIKRALEMTTKGQYRTRARVEPILQEMDEYLDSFNVQDE